MKDSEISLNPTDASININSILPLAESAGFRVGETVNVLLFGEGGYESFQTLTDVDVRRKYGVYWLVLRWAPGKPTPWGTQSCGFAGWEVNETLRQRLLELAAATTER